MRNLLIRILVWVGHVGQGVERSVLSEHLRIEDCNRVVDGEKVGSEELDVSRGNPVVGKLLRNITIDVVLVIFDAELAGLQIHGTNLPKHGPVPVQFPYLPLVQE